MLTASWKCGWCDSCIEPWVTLTPLISGDNVTKPPPACSSSLHPGRGHPKPRACQWKEHVNIAWEQKSQRTGIKEEPEVDALFPNTNPATREHLSWFLHGVSAVLPPLSPIQGLDTAEWPLLHRQGCGDLGGTMLDTLHCRGTPGPR